MRASHREKHMSQQQDDRDTSRRRGAVLAVGSVRRRPAWLIPLLALVALLALGLLLYGLLHGSGKKKTAAPISSTAPSSAASPSASAAGGPAPSASPSSGGSGGTAGSAGGDSSAGGAALVGGGGVAVHQLGAGSGSSGPAAGSGAASPSAGSSAGGSSSSGAAGTRQGTVLFASNSARLDAGARQVIAAAAARIKAQHPSSVAVTGYTDVVGGTPTNTGLSQQRAEAVASVLRTELGAGGAAVTATAKGQSNPVATNSTAAGRQQNRRAEITTS